MAFILSALFSILMAGFLFYEACPSRARLAWGQGKPARSRILRTGGFALLLVALLLLVLQTGMARGISLWFGLVMVGTLANILLASWRPLVHQRAGVGAAAGLVIALTTAGFEVVL